MGFSSLRYLMNPTFSAVEQSSAGGSPMSSNKSSLKDFLLSIASMSGDLSNITAPPFVLDSKSVVEIPSFWAENPAMFVSVASSEDPIERALLVLKSFLAGMKSQCYMGHSEAEGVKKPLNAFLGELFLGHWEDKESGNTYLASEQVSHHPPITACRVWNPQCGVIAEGYNRQKVTFSWAHMAVNISSTGFALKTIEKYNEYYLLPLPNFKVKGVLSGAPYPETDGKWYIPSTNGYMSMIDFTSSGGFLGGGKKHEFTAVLYKDEDGPKQAIYSVSGCWNTSFVIKDERSGKIVETYEIGEEAKALPPLQLPPVEEMDPWETRRAWHDTREAIAANDFSRVSAAKSFLEQGQRNMRKEEERNGTPWQPLFFKNSKSHEIVAELMAKTPGQDFAKTLAGTNGIWAFDAEAYDNASRPFHPDLEPDNLKEGEERVYKNGARASFQASPSTTPRVSIDGGSRPRMSMSSPTASPSGSIDGGSRPRTNMSSPSRKSIDVRDGRRPSLSLEAKHKARLEEKLGGIDYGRRASLNATKIDSGRVSPKDEMHSVTKQASDPQVNGSPNKMEELGSGVDGLSVNDKVAVEDMLRDTYSTGQST